jgi:hypothetical protein
MAIKKSTRTARKKKPARKAAKKPRAAEAAAREAAAPASEPAMSARDERGARRAVEATSRAASAAANAALGASRRAVQASPTIVLRAASIIEEEVAMGIGAVKRIEQRFLDVDALRSQHPDHVMSRFRRDAHEAVDIILDIVTAAASTVGEQAGRMVNVTASHMPRGTSAPEGNGAPQASATRLTTVRVPGTVAAGDRGEVSVSLENESEAATAEFTLHSSELVSAGGHRIPADHVTFDPATLSVPPRESGLVKVMVTVPAKSPAGMYEGLLRATHLDGLRAMLVVQVA